MTNPQPTASCPVPRRASRPLTRLLVGLAAVLAISWSSVSAQDEKAFFTDAAESLNAFATRCFKAKYPLRAREVWQEILRDYDTDDEVARKALGFLKVGASWAPDSRFEYPTQDEPDPAVARVLSRQWDKLCEELAEDHRSLAGEFKAAGNEERAEYHFARVLRFAPEDGTAVAETGLETFEGLHGTPVELAILRRSKLIDRTIAAELEKEYPVEKLSGETHPLIDKAKVPYSGFRTEHFVVWGDWSDEQLIACAQYAERAYALCTTLFDGIAVYKWPHKDQYDLAFFQARDTWVQVLRANEGEFSGRDLEFTIANTSGTSMGSGTDMVKIVGFESAATIEDMAVRAVAQAWARFGADALQEGIGHAVVGWFFGRNLVFSVGQQKGEGTSSGAKAEKFNMPDLSIWQELALRIAWEETDTPCAKLPLVTAADFSSVDRIKAWGICDYLLRRDPELLWKLDRTKVEGAGSQNQVREKFSEKTEGKLTCDGLDDAWRRFWTEDSPILRAVMGKETPLESVSKDAPKFLVAFNEVRKLFDLSGVHWSAEYSGACKQHADYLAENKRARGPVDEHTQDPSDGGTNNGRTFAGNALVDVKAKNPDDTIENWLQFPGYRDALCDPGLESVGIYADKGILVMDVIRGRSPAGKLVRFPNGVAVGGGVPANANATMVVPTSVKVGDLGPDVERVLANAGQKRAKTVGYPLSLHFFATGALPKQGSVQCIVKRNDKELVEGVVHYADGGASRRSSAPGLVVFYPFEALKRGSAYTVEWSFEKQGGREALQKYQFFTK